MQTILVLLKEQGHSRTSRLKEWEINKLFDKIASKYDSDRQYDRDVAQQIWDLTQQDQFGKVQIGDYLDNLEKYDKLNYLLPEYQKSQLQIEYNNKTLLKHQLRQSVEDSEYSDYKVKAEEYSDRNSQQPESFVSQAKQTISQPLNASLMASVQGSLIIAQSLKSSQIAQKQQIPKKQIHKKQQIPKRQLVPKKQQVTKKQQKKIEVQKASKEVGSKKPQIKKQANSLHQKLIPNDKASLLDDQAIKKEPIKKQKKRFIQKQFRIPLICLAIGIFVLIISFVVQSELQSKAIDQVILSKDNQNIWAHFPGDTKTQIDRNWTFFNIINPQQMLLYNQKPKFRQISGFKIIQLEDYLNITYLQDGDRVRMIDWLHFSQQPQTRNLDEKVQVLNVGGLGYWYNLKIARPTVILQQGLSLLFSNLEDSIMSNVFAQSIKNLYLQDFQTAYANIFSIAELTQDEAFFVWSDPAYGMGNQDNLKYWIDAVPTQQEIINQRQKDISGYLRNYFTFSDGQINVILTKFALYKESVSSLVIQNNYCPDAKQCTGRYLAYRQMSNSYVTQNPPSGTPIKPTKTICESNVTCQGSFPQLNAYYKNVFLVKNPNFNKSLTFDDQLMKRWVNYNYSTDPMRNYTTDQDCLFHIGNLDALWQNGTLADQHIQSQLTSSTPNPIPNLYLQNIRMRFGLSDLQQSIVFWNWIKYLHYEVILRNKTNEELGIGNLFASGLYKSFSHLQNNLQPFLLQELVYHQIKTKSQGDCINFIKSSMELKQQTVAQGICDVYGDQINKQFVQNMIQICSNKFGHAWKKLKSNFGVTASNIGSLCDPNQLPETFGSILHSKRVYLNDLYNCTTTPKNYCSDFELAAIQWSSSKVTLEPAPQLNLSLSHSFSQWDSNMQKFEYSYYTSRYNKTFPSISISSAYSLLNFDNWFSASIALKQFISQQTPQQFKAYMRYIGIVSGLNGLTMKRSPRQMIFGYRDQILEQVRTAYPPFGGDPSTPSLVAFNDPNITQQQASMELQWSTGKKDFTLVGQYRKINGRQWLNIPKDSFNGNVTTTDFVSPWDGQDYFYGTSAKQFSPNQFVSSNISLYVPNIQRYGSGSIESTFDFERYGFDLKIGYLGESIYESTSESDFNIKYFQSYHAVFNETSVVGLPLFVTKNHFMNCTSNWSQLIEIYNQDLSIKYEQTSHWDDSFVIVQPYTGVSFQSTIFLQTNYYHNPDQLLNFYSLAFLPLFSLCRSGNITQQVVNDLLSPLLVGLSVKKWTKIVGIIVIVLSAAFFAFVYYKKNKAAQQLKQSQVKRTLMTSNLGISMQPMSAEELNLSSKDKLNAYTPPPVSQQLQE